MIDAQGRMIREEEVENQTFGTFNTQVQLDENAPVGEYRIQATYIKQNDPKRKTDGAHVHRKLSGATFPTGKATVVPRFRA